MAKKTGKKPAAKKVKKQKPATVESILEECRQAVLEGLEDTALGQDAKEYWEKTYRVSIAKKLETGDTWEADKDKVLHVAKKLGKVAAALTDEGKEVESWAAKAATVATKKDPSCPPTATRGGYCETA